MLGYILYESVEITYTVLKLGYNAISGTYNWYYGIDNKTDEQIKLEKLEKDEENKDNIIKNLEERINKLENILEN